MKMLSYSLHTNAFTFILYAHMQTELLCGSEVRDLTIPQRLRTPNHMVYRYLDEFPMSIKSGIIVIRYWLKLVHIKKRNTAKTAQKGY